MADEEEKTEEATPKKLEDARKKGQVAQSRDVSTVLLLASAALALASPLSARLGGLIYEMTQRSWGGTLVRPDSLADYHAVLLYFGAVAGLALAPFGLVFLVTAFASNLVQIGWMISPEAMAFKPEKMNPISGMKRMFSMDRLYELAKALFRVGVVVWIVWYFMRPAIPEVLTLMAASVTETARVGGELLQRTMWVILAVFAVFAVVDFVWQRYQHAKKNRMTKQEVRDESKQREGDPKVKSRIRQIQREVAQRRMFDAIGEADVVVMNPTHFAVALQYRPPEQSSPKVLAKGRNHIALRIRARAEELGVPVVVNPPVAQLLYKTAKIDQEIPEALYQAVAEVLAYVYKLKPKRGKSWSAA
ncbi:MAG: flagellar biosynthesis protein FlhB [Myxococcota bacterium]